MMYVLCCELTTYAMLFAKSFRSDYSLDKCITWGLRESIFVNDQLSCNLFYCSLTGFTFSLIQVTSHTYGGLNCLLQTNSKLLYKCKLDLSLWCADIVRLIHVKHKPCLVRGPSNNYSNFLIGSCSQTSGFRVDRLIRASD